MKVWKRRLNDDDYDYYFDKDKKYTNKTSLFNVILHQNSIMKKNK